MIAIAVMLIAQTELLGRWSNWHLIWCGLFLGFLPWLHTQNILFAVILAVALVVVRRRRRPLPARPLLMGLGVAGAFWVLLAAYNLYVFGRLGGPPGETFSWGATAWTADRCPPLRRPTGNPRAIPGHPLRGGSLVGLPPTYASDRYRHHLGRHCHCRVGRRVRRHLWGHQFPGPLPVGGVPGVVGIRRSLPAEALRATALRRRRRDPSHCGSLRRSTCLDLESRPRLLQPGGLDPRPARWGLVGPDQPLLTQLQSADRGVVESESSLGCALSRRHCRLGRHVRGTAVGASSTQGSPPSGRCCRCRHGHLDRRFCCSGHGSSDLLPQTNAIPGRSCRRKESHRDGQPIAGRGRRSARVGCSLPVTTRRLSRIDWTIRVSRPLQLM